MAFQVYKEGSTHTIRGIECDLMNVNTVSSAQAMLKNGWYSSPEEIGDGAQDTEEKAMQADDEATEEASEAEKELNPIREKAKAAGIEGWDKKRIKTLEAELDVA